MTIDKKLVELEKLSTRKYLIVFIKTILMIPIAIVAHIFGATITMLMIPNTVYDLIHEGTKVKQIIAKRKTNGTV